MGLRLGRMARAGAVDLASGADFLPDAAVFGPWRSYLPRAALGLGLAALFLWLLAQRLHGLDLPAVGAAASAVPAGAWALALGLTVAAFWAVGQYDVVLHRHFETGAPPRAARAAGISAIAVSQTLGLGLITGAVLRWRMMPGQSVWAATRITLAVALSFLAGWAVVTACAVLLLGPSQFIWPAAAVLALAGAAVVVAMIRPPVPFRWPNLFTITALVGLCAVDTVAAAGALYVLMPQDLALSFAALLPAFLLAYGAGLLSGTPGGIGAFELALLALLPDVPAEPVLAAVIVWRLVYFVIPAILGAGVAIRGPRAATVAPMAALHPHVHPWAKGHALRGPAELGLMGQGEHCLLAQGDCGQMVAPRGHVLVGLLDPLARQSGLRGRGIDHAAALDMLALRAAQTGRWPALYKVSARMASAARRKGWRSWRIAREAVLVPQTYDPATPARAGLRRKLRRAEAAGLTVTHCPAVGLPLPAMAALAQDWAQRHGGERGFSMGRFDPSYIAGQRVYLAYVQGHLVGFITLHAPPPQDILPSTWVLDLMRPGADMPDGGMQALVDAALMDAKAAGVSALSLAAAPEMAFAPKGRAARLCRALGLDSGQGLRQFKEGFAPQWQARYLCAPHRAGGAMAALSIWRAVWGGVWGGGGADAHNRFALPARIWHSGR